MRDLRRVAGAVRTAVEGAHEESAFREMWCTKPDRTLPGAVAGEWETVEYYWNNVV
jgi:hypothetical protein